MYKRAGKQRLLGLLVLAMVVTSIVGVPTDAQAAKKKTQKAAIASVYREQGICMSGQPGYFEKNPEDFSKDTQIIVNRNKKAKYTFYSSDSSKLKISSAGKVTSVYGNDGDIVKVTIKETYKKKTRTVGVLKVSIVNPKILNTEVTWYVGSDGMMAPQEAESWISSKVAKKYYKDIPTFQCGTFKWFCDDKEFDAQEVLKEINGEKEKNTIGKGNADTYLTWDSKKQQFYIKEEGKLYFAYYALNYKTNKYYYVGSFVANLKKCTKAKSVYLAYGDENEIVVGDEITIEIKPNPIEYIGDVKVTSSDAKVATATLAKDKKTIDVKALQEGETTITVELNGAKETAVFYVARDTEEDDD